MKNLLIITALSLGLQFTANAAVPSPTLIASVKESTSNAFLFIRGHKLGRTGYGLQWRMTSNAGIERFEIQCTYEDPTDMYSNWTPIGNMGNSNTTICRFTDPNVAPGDISYRIIAVLSNGAGTMTSETLSITID